MSHFVLLAFAKPDDIDELLAPYDEQLSVKPYVRLTRQQAAQERRDTIRKMDFMLADPDCTTKYNVAYIQQRLEQLHSMTDAQYFTEETRYDEKFNKKGEPISTCNPNGHYDWYEIGGRWKDYFLLKSGKIAHTTTIGQVDLPGMERKVRNNIDAAWKNNLSSPFREPSITTKEQYLQYALDGIIVPYAYLLPGDPPTWVGKGRMGWFGTSVDNEETVSHARRFREVWKSLPPTTPVTVVDCHT